MHRLAGRGEPVKQLLVKRKDRFARALTEKLLAYGCGRKLVPADRPHVDALLTALGEAGDGMRDLMRLVVLSEPFRSP